MERKELNIDRKKHIEYSSSIEKIIKDRLKAKYPDDKASMLWEKMQLKYVDFLSDLPYLGGKKCTHNGAGGTYDCIMLFAYYDVLDRTPSIKELYEMNNEAFLPPFRRLGKIANLNKEWQRSVINKIFEVTAKRDMKWEKECPTSYIMRVEPHKKNMGVKYVFHRCPIACFAKAHGYTEIMPAFCNGDYPAIEILGGKLIRENTCANSDICDYFIVGSDDPIAEQYPMYVDDNGYMRNKKTSKT